MVTRRHVGPCILQAESDIYILDVNCPRCRDIMEGSDIYSPFQPPIQMYGVLVCLRGIFHWIHNNLWCEAW